MNKQVCNILISLLVFLVITLFMLNDAFAASNARVTVKVVDEEGKAVGGANVGMGFRIYLVWDSKSIQKEGITDSNGLYSASENSDNYVGFRISKGSYYQSFGELKFNEVVNGRWEPWNPELTVVLRKIENPVPMYSRNTQLPKALIIPAIGTDIGFDLIEYDWMPPYGKGKTTDFVFRADRRFANDRDFDCILTITFPNKYDGIQVYSFDRNDGSVFKLPRFAPESGYQQKLIRTVSRKPGGPLIESYKENNNYFFRVRSEEKDGKLVRSMYGKIHGDIRFDPRGKETVSILFKYFLNPDFTRNMESGENLFGENIVGVE